MTNPCGGCDPKDCTSAKCRVVSTSDIKTLEELHGFLAPLGATLSVTVDKDVSGAFEAHVRDRYGTALGTAIAWIPLTAALYAVSDAWPFPTRPGA